MSTAIEPRFLTRAEAAEILKIRPQTLARWAMTGEGPKFRKINARVVRYEYQDVIDFAQSFEARSTSGI
jgi:hypothetical protein